MADGLPLSDVVNATISLSPLAAARRSFGGLLVLGDSDVIDVGERLRPYTSITEVATDFGTSAPEYLAALLFFSQTPRPNFFYVGRYARTATAGRLNGRSLTVAQQAIAGFQAITSGGFSITIDGTARTLSSINLSAAANLNAVAAAITTGLSTWGVCTWVAAQGRFEIRSTTTGASSTVASVATATPLATLLGITAAQTPRAVAGVIAETPAAAAAALADKDPSWYALMFASSTMPTTAEHTAVAAFIEAAAPSRIYGVTSQDTGVVSSSSTTDVAAVLNAALYNRTLVQYSSSSPYAVASLFGRMLTVDFSANNSTITLKFKQQPGVVAEVLSSSQAAALRAKKANAFVSYENDTAIIIEGTMASGEFIDTIHGADWFQNAAQTDVYNLLYTSTTKIPQTEAGLNQIINTIEATCVGAVNNGLAAPGFWTADGFGKLKRGDYLPKGFYVYALPLSLQPQADREARRSPTIQVALKLGGAVHSVNLQLNVNR